MEASDNPLSADNQQERPGIDEWIVGFTDGEGCFSISVVRNELCRLGWQVQHEFSVTQAAGLERSSRADPTKASVADRLSPTGRSDNHEDLMLRFSVKRQRRPSEDNRSVLQNQPTPYCKAC